MKEEGEMIKNLEEMDSRPNKWKRIWEDENCGKKCLRQKNRRAEDISRI